MGIPKHVMTLMLDVFFSIAGEFRPDNVIRGFRSRFCNSLVIFPSDNCIKVKAIRICR